MAGQEAELKEAEALVRAHRELARTAEPEALVSSLARICEPYGPAMIMLIDADIGQSGGLEGLEVVAACGARPDSPMSAILGKRLPLDDNLLHEAALADARAPLIVTDVEVAPQFRSVVAGLPGPVRSFVLLPLYSMRHAAWRGFALFHWPEPHVPGPKERLLYDFLVTTLSESIAAERTLRAYQQSLADNEQLLRRAELALQESQRQSTMLRTLLDNLPLGVVVVRIVEGGRFEVVTSAGKVDPRSEWGTTIDLTTVTAYGPGEDEPLPMERMPAFLALQTGRAARAELEVPLSNGTRRLLDCTATPMHFEGDPSIYLIVLYNDVTEYRRTERERLAAQEQLLQIQTVALAERSTPLIPIRSDVLIMPLVGNIDEQRGRQIIETLVNLGGRNNVRAAIIDVTGVPSLDTAAASALIGSAQALRLRGVRPILTGIQSNAAMTLVALGIDFSGIAVKATLQDGVALATQN